MPENAVNESKLRAAQGEGTYLIRAAVAGEPRKSRKQLLEEIAANRFGPPMMGDSVKRSWVLAMLHFIEKKIAVAQKPSFSPSKILAFKRRPRCWSDSSCLALAYPAHRGNGP